MAEVSKCDNNPQGGCGKDVPVTEITKTDDDLCSMNFARSCSQLSTLSTMSENSPVTFVYRRRKFSTILKNSAVTFVYRRRKFSTMSKNSAVTFVYRRRKYSTMSKNSAVTFVYRRRKLRRISLAVLPVKTPAETMPSGCCLSAISYEASSVAAKEEIIVSLDELENEAVRAPVFLPVKCNRGALVSKSGSIDKCVVEESGSGEAPESDVDKILDFCCVNDSCSSSQSDMELGSAFFQTEVENTGECSSSDAVVVKGIQDDLLEKNICISILKNEGLLGGVQPIRACISAESMCTSSDNCCLQSCEVCNQSETSLKMLICDHCEEAFHVSCCNPRTQKILDGKWFCHSCLKKKHKILKEKTTSKSLHISNETGRCGKAMSKGDLGPIAVMLKGYEPYITSVRIGKDFQAEVPDWLGPIIDDVDTIESSEINLSGCVRLHELNFIKPSRLGSIGNWLQCREVIDAVGEGVDRTICGKWRRAPLFEVQTDDWECFRTVLWDPVHADCAVPQELDTDQVLKHLKYIEMLRHQLGAKRRKLGCTRSVGSQDLTKNVRNIQTR